MKRSKITIVVYIVLIMHFGSFCHALMQDTTQGFIPVSKRVEILSYKAEQERSKRAYYDTGLGVLSIATALVVPAESKLFYSILGGGFVLLGIRDFSQSTKLEKDSFPLLTMNEGVNKELYAEEIFRSSAKDSKDSRKSSSLVIGVIGAGSMLAGSVYIPFGLILVGTALWSWTQESDIEKAYDQYVVEKTLIMKGESHEK